MAERADELLAGLASQHSVIPVVENRGQFVQILEQAESRILVLRHCNLLELEPLLLQAHQRGYTVYVNMDHVDGVHADAMGLHYLARQMHVSGIESTNPKVLAMAKMLGLKTILHIYVADSTGLTSALEVTDVRYVDLLDVSPALAIPYIKPALTTVLPLPFLASGLISTARQLRSVLRTGAAGVLMTQNNPTS